MATPDLSAAIVGVHEYPSRDVQGRVSPLQIKAESAAAALADAGLGWQDVDAVYDAGEGGGMGGLTIADKSGRVRWFRPAGFGGKGTQVYNFQTQTYKDRPVLTYWKGASTGRGFSQRGNNEILNNK